MTILIGAAIFLSFMGFYWGAMATSVTFDEISELWDHRNRDRLPSACILHVFATLTLLSSLYLLYLRPFGGTLFLCCLAVLLTVHVILHVVAFRGSNIGFFAGINEGFGHFFRIAGALLAYSVAVYLPTSWVFRRFEETGSLSAPHYLIAAQTAFFFILFPFPVFLLRMWWLDLQEKHENQQRRDRQEQEANWAAAQQQARQAAEKAERMREQAEDESEVKLWQGTVGFELPQPIANRSSRNVVESEIRSIPKYPDFRVPAATLAAERLNQQKSEKIFAHYRRAIIAFYKSRLEAGEDHHDLFESMKLFFSAACLFRTDEEAEAIDRLAKPSTPEPVRLDASRLKAELEAIKSAGFPPDFEKQEIERARRKHGV